MLLSLCIYSLLLLLPGCLTDRHPLEQYVQRPDASYSFTPLTQYMEDDYSVHVLNMTSQTWMTDEFSSQTDWWHYLAIVIPHEIRVPDAAGILIGLGSVNDDPPGPNDEFVTLLAQLAVDIGGVTALITNVPNQPIVFKDDPAQVSRSEDAIIAYTWGVFMNDTHPRETDVLLYMPMVKSVVRAMDTIEDYTTSLDAGLDIEKFFITGPSKRGWTTYLTAAIDDRVFGIAPMVISMLNIVPNLHHHYQSLGGWSWAFGDYWREGLTERLDSEDAALLVTMQDPYEFIERYTMPKLLIKAGNDEFFAIDDNQFFFDELPGVKYHWVLENAMHAMIGHYDRMIENIGTFFLNIYEERAWPEFTFLMDSNEETGRIRCESSVDPEDVTVWYAHTSNDDNRRDWRWLVLGDDGNQDIQFGVFYSNDVEAEEVERNVFEVSFDAPEDGWLIFFITVRLPTGVEGRVLELSTDVNVVPNTFHYEDCQGAECKGVLK